MVAYADDTSGQRDNLVTVLNSYGNVNVYIQANNGRELIELILKSDTFPDVVMLDINMPVMNGFETLNELMRRWPDLKTLIVTVHGSELYIMRMITGGAKGFLLKSSFTRQIERAILTIYNDGIYYSEETKAFKDHKIKLPNFTERELTVLKYCCSDLSYQEIARKMETTAKSVEGIKENLFKKLKVNSRLTLALYAIELGIVTKEISPEITIENLR